ncbi:hypothetical protein F5Y18DRAFT_430756 [Xylariaceae sp. FL1019]|nr:hypothetical protein F5Y18DRAFT_430756 [Xylariaceae sp. FL1019]
MSSVPALPSGSSYASSSASSTDTLHPSPGPSHITVPGSSDNLSYRDGFNSGRAFENGFSDGRTYQDGYDDGFSAGFRSGRKDRNDELDDRDRGFLTSLECVKKDMDLLREELITATRTISLLRREREEATAITKKLEENDEEMKHKIQQLRDEHEETTTMVQGLFEDQHESAMTVQGLREDHEDVAQMVKSIRKVNSVHEEKIGDAKLQIKDLRRDVTSANNTIQYLETHVLEATDDYTPSGRASRGQCTPWYTLERLQTGDPATKPRDQAGATFDAHSENKRSSTSAVASPISALRSTLAGPHYNSSGQLVLPSISKPSGPSSFLEWEGTELEHDEKQRQAKRRKRDDMSDSSEYRADWW